MPVSASIQHDRPASWSQLFSVCNRFSARLTQGIAIVSSEAFATFKYILPAALKWTWRKYISREIASFQLQATVNQASKIAHLYFHGKINCVPTLVSDRSLLLVPGDHGHPFSLLHLADSAQKKGMRTFSLHIPGVHDNQQFELHDQLVKCAVDKIESLVHKEEGKFGGVLGIGHSKGAILLAHRQFVRLDPRLNATCAIAGRLNAPRDADCDNEKLRAIVRGIYQGIVDNPTLPLMQIVPKDDWNASQESMMVRPLEQCYSVPGRHLNVLFQSETQALVSAFIENKRD